ncbi:hypothetical protein [Paenibacillus sp. XY044]|uniref:hypothetical protein n=1 Tax=Paenibacillus sp. XY044 TaxID=2026089 RepID=UPI000B988CB5|nr:hypothetical protein [Paenibacillus sp. XY044]OZB90045.1 hypothetical protein CJP46_35280 [Paenibacillus sp. XY044]
MNRPRQQRQNRIPRPNLDGYRQGSFVTPSFKESLESYSKEKIVFSWRYFDGKHEAFNCGNADKSWFMDLMEVMKNVSNMSLNEYMQCKPLRVHSHDWSKVTYKYDHLTAEQVKQIENDTTQFSISQAKGRVHGFLIENLLFVVWFDPDHNLYPGDRDLVLARQPLSSYEILQLEHDTLKEEYESLLKEKEALETNLLQCLYDKEEGA